MRVDMSFCRFCTIAALTTLISLSNSCVHLPSNWCSSKDIAAECGVLEQCRKFVWSRQSEDEHYWGSEKPVELGFYYEVLCPDCKDFMRDQLWPTYKAVPEIFHVDFVPYGNAREYPHGDKWIFECQHGEEECLGNLIHACALNAYPLNVTFPFINCMETSEEILVKESAKKCSQQHGLSFSELMRCVDGDEGNRLQHLMALKTDALMPPHRYVPWITLDGVHTEDMQDEASRNLLGLLCRTYQGPKPPSCKRKRHGVCRRTF